MAWLENRSDGGFRVVFRYRGQKIGRSVLTNDERAANAALVLLEDNLRRIELGTLQVPENADIATFLLSNGNQSRRQVSPELKTLKDLSNAYLASIPKASIEPGTRKMLEIHIRHLHRILGESSRFRQIGPADLQMYVDRRGTEPARKGKSVSAVTIQKEIRTLSAIWRWGSKHSHVSKTLPTDGLRYAKTTAKPPFQTFAQIRRKIERGGLTEYEVADLWECLFLTLPEIEQLLGCVEAAANHRFIYPMFVMAAHTGARRSELLRSEIDDFDFSTSTVVIREKKRVRGQCSTRTVPLSPFLTGALRKWFNIHPGGRYTFTFDVHSRSTKERREYEAVTRSEAQDHFRRTLDGGKWANVRGWHVFRHSFCSNCAAAGVDQRVINAWVGHQTEDMVRRYRHLVPNQQREAIMKVFGE